MTVCTVCHHHCRLEEGQIGLCQARVNRGGKIVCKNYGQLTALALDPIEKKPLRQFYPGSLILSMGSYGCNLRCPFCQNAEISMSGGETIETVEATPETLVKKALSLTPHRNIGLAYTYNEPLVGYEFVRDCAKLARENDLKNVVVTNGSVSEEILEEILPYIDAMNIDIKAFTERFYQMVGGDIEEVKRAVMFAVGRCHVEITTLIVPGENDAPEEINALSRWVASVSPDIPLHVTRFFPRWKMLDKGPTPVKTVYRLAEIARKHLRFVYEGNC